jgi:hypothetical protein
MQIPYVYILYIYFASLALWGLFSLVGFYHLFSYGFKTKYAYLIGVIYAVGSVAIVLAQLTVLNGIDWQGAYSLPLPSTSIEAGSVWGGLNND